ncbi:putative Delta(7)-sterol 5(6)-desaturase [Frankliniella fusca]|uniref:Delta(7)-sterol 5(6)-desaturase n=1 Tax=Frankliniella fusca TaxID=407009 RepID=A0AAE1LJZ3_9NEOP|nr:putative Delta(7)-sterol 5(6)-desaturase [Frankliniella fusca]
MAPRTRTQVISEPPAPAPAAPPAAEAKASEAADKQRWNPTSLTWSEHYSEGMEKGWARVPGTLKKILVTLAVFTMGLAMSGDWVVILVHLRRQLGLDPIPESLPPATTLRSFIDTRFKDFTHFWIWSNIVSYSLYFGIGGFLHWYFYVRQRASAAEWKCQPNSWLSTDLELHEIKLGSLSLLCTGSFSSVLACWIYNGGWSSVYYDWDAYGAAWFFLQVPVIFLYQDYVTYLLHRAYHTPWLYKHFHKLHHKYKHPTAFSVTAIHPVEVLHIQITLCLPLFAFPTHWATFYTIALYTYYHGIIDHSGINFKAYWWQPWQPDAIFHDNHHQYFHVNFGFNCWVWDKLHGTYRRKDRVYTEDTFYGRGKALTDATQEELAQDLKERISENPRAYRNDNMEFALSEEEVKNMKQKSSSRR